MPHEVPNSQKPSRYFAIISSTATSATGRISSFDCKTQLYPFDILITVHCCN